MNCTTVAVDVAKNVYELAIAGSDWRIVERHRLTRAKFAGFFVQRPPCAVVMEACGMAHHWGRLWPGNSGNSSGTLAWACSFA